MPSVSAFFYSIAAISVGAAFGAILRWLLSLSFNTLFPLVSAGTLLANLIGAYLIGLALALFAEYPEWGIEWRLFIITGFLGGLTTFSSFSAEVVALLQQARWGWAGLVIAAHVVGSIVMTFLGFASIALGLKR